MRTLVVSETSFIKNENKFKVECVTSDVSLRRGYKTEDDGVLWGMQHATVMKANYSEDDKLHNKRMREYNPIKNGETVVIEGNEYVARILGNYSSCVIFDPK
ncbi:MULTISPECIES: hypothetical protein [unclassified Bacillus cereus group]|uniref:hypothetical protein n=1 Tax=unclassified Bacillus cereus group TaxID=2750818 RepID=UPI001F58D14E|nr:MULTISPECIES: hypothetical protein [unclassified Bacillus cereus group]